MDHVPNISNGAANPRLRTDLPDAEWEWILPLLPKPPRRERRRTVDLREILNAIRYMTRSGGGWRMLPKDFPPWQTVYWCFRHFVRLMLFRTIQRHRPNDKPRASGPRGEPQCRFGYPPDRKG